MTVPRFYEMFTSPKVYEGTLQLPYPSREQWRKRIAETDGYYNLVAVSGEHVIGMLDVGNVSA
jgi:putative acetyltransferase